jgi:CheY-like chemotaxis protein/DNA-binding Xre family transcriptional regulator
MIVVEQIRGARAMLGIKQGDLAKQAGISVSTLNNIERGVQTDPKISTLRAIQHALEQEGIEFTDSDGGRIGIFLRTNVQAMPSQTVLIIDDSETDRALYKAWLSRRKGRSYVIREADNARDGYATLLSSKPDCILLDYMMYGMTGLQLLAEMEKDKIQLPPVIFITASHDPVVARTLREQGVNTFIHKKDLSREKLYTLLDDAMDKRVNMPLAAA